MITDLDLYAKVAGEDVINHLRQLAVQLQGMKVVHVNSTRLGGGVAEILNKLVPLLGDLGIDSRWEIIYGNEKFYECTKGFHNALQGNLVKVPDPMLRNFETVNAENAERLRPVLQDADIVLIHDPQPAPLIKYFPDRKGKWIWRCHIDISHPFRPVWKYLRQYTLQYDASIFSLDDFAQPLPHPQYLIPPSIDPLSDKNIDLSPEEINRIYSRFNIDPEKPLILQVSRFDRFKDPVGVIHAFRLAKKFSPNIQLVLAGGEATDDPEGEAVLNEVRVASEDDPDINILLLPPDDHRTINALQRAADVVVQKSIREGFGLTVTEALWKGRPVIGGNTGGIRLQVVNHHTGFLVDTPEGAALWIRYLLYHKDKRNEMGVKAREFVRQNFLLTRHLREYLTTFIALTHARMGRILLG